MTLDEIDRSTLMRCCGSTRWVDGMLMRQPFIDREMLVSAAESVWWNLGPSDWLEAFSAHPEIGAKKLSGWCSQEQSGVESAANGTLARLAEANGHYKDRFGWIFLINATGKTATELLEALIARLNNGQDEELRVAAAEQAKITKLRLEKLLDT